MLPAMPQGFLVQQGNGQVYLSWNIVPGSTSYDVQRSTDNVTFASLATPTDAFYLDTTPLLGVQYYYKVASVNAGGTSSYTLAQGVVPTMPGQITLGQIRLQAQQRADRVGSAFVGTAEWNTYINQSYYELYDLLTTVYEDYYTALPLTFVTDGSTVQYPLPDGVLYDAAKPFYKLLGVDCGLAQDQNAFVSIHKFDFIERNRYIYPNITSSFLGVFNLRYRVFGNTLYFIPQPSAGQIIRVWYIPRMAILLQDTDILDGINGWSEYVIVDAAIKALQKEESDTSVLMAQKAALMDRINSSAQNRDAGQPDSISDVRSGMYPGAGGPGWDGSFGGY